MEINKSNQLCLKQHMKKKKFNIYRDFILSNMLDQYKNCCVSQIFVRMNKMLKKPKTLQLLILLSINNDWSAFEDYYFVVILSFILNFE